MEAQKVISRDPKELGEKMSDIWERLMLANVLTDEEVETFGRTVAALSEVEKFEAGEWVMPVEPAPAAPPPDLSDSLE